MRLPQYQSREREEDIKKLKSDAVRVRLRSFHKSWSMRRSRKGGNGIRIKMRGMKRGALGGDV